MQLQLCYCSGTGFLPQKILLSVWYMWSHFSSLWVSSLLISPALSLGYMQQRENSGSSSLCWSLDPVVPSPSAIFSPPFRILYIKHPRFLVIFEEREGKSIYFIFQKLKFSLIFLFKEYKDFCWKIINSQSRKTNTANIKQTYMWDLEISTQHVLLQKFAIIKTIQNLHWIKTMLPIFILS